MVIKLLTFSYGLRLALCPGELIAAHCARQRQGRNMVSSLAIRRTADTSGSPPSRLMTAC